MPEGDTIHRTAERLRTTMNGRTIVAAVSRWSTRFEERLSGRSVRDVEARGKHLLIHVTDDWVIHSHLGMNGSWHLYRPAETWRMPPHQADLVMQLQPASNSQTDAATAEPFSSFDQFVCFRPKLLELLTRDEMRRHRWLSRLGPDLLSETFDTEAAIQRMRTHPQTAIGEAVMNQTIVSGIGNVYKSELLFLLGCDPWRRVDHVTDVELESLFQQARYWLRQNLQGGPRRTRNDLRGERVWVYGRQGKPCRRCGTTIRMSRQGDLGRSTYWCPHCQPS